MTIEKTQEITGLRWQPSELSSLPALPKFPGRPPKLPSRQRSVDAAVPEDGLADAKVSQEGREKPCRTCAPTLPKHKPSLYLDSRDLMPIEEKLDIEDDNMSVVSALTIDTTFAEEPPKIPQRRSSLLTGVSPAIPSLAPKLPERHISETPIPEIGEDTRPVEPSRKASLRKILSALAA